MRPTCLVAPLACLLLSGFATVARAQEQVAVQLTPVVGQYALQEVSFQLPGEPGNLYDPAQIAVDGEFTAPSGQKLLLPAFYWESGPPAPGNAVGAPAWKLRFTPVEIGSYILRLQISRRGQSARQAGIAAFDCIASDRAGFVWRSGRYFKLSAGEDFFPIGANRCWGEPGSLDPYLQDMKALSEAGGNCLRIWLAPWWLPIEKGPGVYDSSAAARLDRIVQQAEALHLRLIICIEQHGNLQAEGSEIALWKLHPYNAVNGGPCATPPEFFTSPEALRLFRNRLRYLVARWGYSSSVMAWELFNEVEFADYGPDGFWAHREQVTAWHRDMARYLRERDPWRHLVATSSDIELQRRLLDEEALDMIQIHLYDGPEAAGQLAEKCADLARSVGAPLLVGEYGQKEGPIAPALVTEGVVAAALAGNGAGALPWLQGVVAPSSAYARLGAARLFLEKIRWEDGQFVPMPVAVIRQPGGPAHVIGLKGRKEMVVVAWPGPGAREGAELALRVGGAQGRFTCEAWDLQRGETLRNSTLTATETGLDLNLNAFMGPVGFKLERLP